MPKIVDIVDDVYVNITNDIEKIQTKPTMYISHTGPEACGHLCKEVVNNIFDEHANPKSISDGTANIFYDAESGIITCEDHGRGIPFEELEHQCTIIHSGTKMTRAYGDTAGENGVGLTATNALSELFEITSTRNGESMMIKFRDGRKINERKIKISDKNKHGLIVSFRPSAYLLGEDRHLPIESFQDWLQKLSFFMDPSLKVKFTVANLPGKTEAVTKIYKNTEGIGGFLPHMSPDADFMAKPITLENSMTLIEKDIPVWEQQDDGTNKHGVIDLERNLKISFSFNYSTADDQPRIYAFCNDIENVEGGTHQTGVLTGLTNVLLKIANENLRKGDKIELTSKDVLSGLRLVLNLRTNYSTQFEQQTKKKLGNQAITAPVRKLVTDVLTEFFKLQENKKYAQKLSDIIRDNAKIRLDVTQKRSKIKKETLSVLNSKLIAGYAPANLVGKNKDDEELELYIMEGKSAGGLGRQARFNPDIQGVLATRGKPSNVYGISSKKLASDNKKKPNREKKEGESEYNERMAFFVILMDEVLGCGYGDHFDITKLVYKKIILSSDADVDGHHILGLFAADILKHAPELITGGYVYRSVAPLYRLKAKGKVDVTDPDPSLYLYDKNDLFNRFADVAVKNIMIRFDGDDTCVSPANVRRFLFVNRQYYDILSEISTTYKINPDVIEYIIMHHDTYTKKGVMEELDPELHYDKEKQSVSGIYQRRFTNIVFENTVNTKLKSLVRLFVEGNDEIGFYHFYKKDIVGELVYRGYLSIGQIMESVQVYQPCINDRYKGYGEMTEYEMLKLVMNPDHRKLLRFSIHDMDTTLQTFDHLFLKKFSNVRKELVQNANVSIDDIDN